MMTTGSRRLALFGIICLFFNSVATAAEQAAPDYNEQVAPILRKYCSGCHNADDAEGDLSLESYAAIFQGGENGPVVVPGMSKASRLVRVLTKDIEPAMPPEDEPQPSAEDIAILQAWIEAGAKGPAGAEPDRTTLVVPEITPDADVSRSVGSLDFSPDGKTLATARFKEVELRSADTKQIKQTLGDHAGKVNMARYSADGSKIITASGIVGLTGEAVLWNVADGKPLQRFKGHRDTMYAAILSSDGKFLATGSYDRLIILWDTATGKPIREFRGHNGAVYDLAFSPDNKVLASASGDGTIKIWQVSTGKRLDTLSQPLKEQFSVTISPDGRQIVAGGADNRIRVWQLLSIDSAKINPIQFARFAHEGAVVQAEFSPDGSALITVGEDGTIKVWETMTYTETHLFEKQSDVTAAISITPDASQLAVGRMDGSLQLYPLPAAQKTTTSSAPLTASVPMSAEMPMNEAKEAEPNDTIETATVLTLPGTITGVIHPTDKNKTADEDLYRIESKAGQEWVLEVDARRSKSPMDSKIEVLDAKGNRVLRVKLQAVRDSYITFRPIDSGNRFVRLSNPDEMQLNQYLYMRGEVNKLYRMPRGPDSDILFYPHQGLRHGYFGTSGIAHAMNETVYIVEPIEPGTEVVPNGLPVFSIYYQNDDESERRFFRDSRLTFKAPTDGTYFIRVTDVRGFHGEDFTYQLTVRPPKRAFKVNLDGKAEERKLEVGTESGRRIRMTVKRTDGFEGEIRVDIEGVPPGFTVTSPVIFEAEHDVAYGVIHAKPGAAEPTAENAKISKVTATAVVEGKTVTQDVGSLGEISLKEKPKLLVELLPINESDDPNALRELVIAPGTTIKAKLRITRNGFDELVTFAPKNFPHGVIVDNIGLNGIMIVKGQSEREIFLSAEKWMPNSSRTIFIETQQEGLQSSAPVILRVQRP